MVPYPVICRAVHAATAVIACLVLFSSCARPLQQVAEPAGEPVQVAELWQQPDDLERRDLYYGPGGSDLLPSTASFQFVSIDNSGASPGYDVRDAKGLEWSVKIGVEAQPEVAVSRILWAIGFHQPPTYFLREWTISGAPAQVPPEPARFRPELPEAKPAGNWSWYENPFVGTRQHGGLLAANLILANWDWKNTNNRIYELATPRNDVRRWYVVRDLGASLGRFTYPRMLEWTRMRGFGQGTKNDLDGFEQQPFLVADGDRFKVDYAGIYRDLVKSVSAADIRWTCELLARLSDRQWHDAFRAAGYTPEQSARYVNKLKEKVRQGLALPAGASTQ